MNQEKQAFTSVNMEFVNEKACIVVRDFSETPELYRESTVLSYSEAQNRYRKVISFYTAYANIKNKVFKQFPENMSTEFGEYGIMIIDRQKFFERIDNALKQIRGCKEAKMGFVEYMQMDSGLNDWHPFRKDIHRFGYQNEFRITFVNDKTDTYILDLNCSLRDIAVPIMGRDVHKICFEGENISFPTY